MFVFAQILKNTSLQFKLAELRALFEYSNTMSW